MDASNGRHPAPAFRQAGRSQPSRSSRSPRGGRSNRPGTEGAVPPAEALRQPWVALDSQAMAIASERQELVCSLIGLCVKVSLVAVVGVSLVRLASAYQERMERQGELSAVLNLEEAKLAKARERFDQLFMVEGEQHLIREQNQWIAPNRLRVVWHDSRP